MTKNADTTATGDLRARPRATAEQVEAFELDPHLVAFMNREPFYAYIMRHLRKIKTDKVPTAGVVADTSETCFTLYWNPEFLAGLSSDHVRGLLIHECLHLVGGHTTRRRQTPHTVHNWACDLAINCMIEERLLPTGGLVPGKAFAELTPAEEALMTTEALERYNRLSTLIASFEPFLSAEAYFELLKEHAEDIESQAGSKGVKLEDLRVDENGNLVDKNGNPVRVMPGATDDHDWDSADGSGDPADLDDAVKEALEAQLRELLKGAVKRADSSSGGWGSMPAKGREIIRKLASDQIDWRSVLRRFVGTARDVTTTTSWRRANKRFPGHAPGATRKTRCRIAIYVDQSGSVRDRDLALLTGELDNLAGKAEFTIYPFDTEVDVDNAVKHKRRGRVEFQRTRFGGTDFEAPTRHANSLVGSIDAYLILTDGECYKPTPVNRVKRGWVIVPGRKLLFEPDRRDVLIEMSETAVRKSL